MSDDPNFPALSKFKKIEEQLFSSRAGGGSLAGFINSINSALDSIGFTDEFVNSQVTKFSQEELDDRRIEESAAAVTKVIKDVIWGMIELDATTTALLDCPLLQRLRHIRQNGFTYLVYPPASHTRFEHSLGVFAVASRYIDSINNSTKRPKSRFTEGLVTESIAPKLALDIKHAAMLHDSGHLPFSHVLETIYEASPENFRLGDTLVRDFENCIMKELRDSKTHFSEMLSIALILSPRFKSFYSALRHDPLAYLRVACLVSGTPLDNNMPGYSQLISGAVDCDKIDYLLRDSFMCNVPVAIDQARLFLNSALVKCANEATIKKLIDREILTLENADLDKPVLILVLNSSGVDTIEEIAFARATLYERVYRHAVTRNAERILGIALNEARQVDSKWGDVVTAFALSDDTLISSLGVTKSTLVSTLSNRLKQRAIPKRAFVFAPDFYTPVVPYVRIFSDAANEDVSQYYHDIISKEPFHGIVENLKETSKFFLSSKNHADLEARIVEITKIISEIVRRFDEQAPKGQPQTLFFIPLPDHSAASTSCVFVTREGDLESSAQYSRAAQLVSAKEIGRSVGFVSCESGWAEIVFLATQRVLYDYFGDAVAKIDLRLEFRKSGSRPPKTINIGAVKRFYVPESSASRRSRLDRNKLTHYRNILSEANYYDDRPRLATPQARTNQIAKLAERFGDFSGQHGWNVNEETILQYLNQFPPKLRPDALKLLESVNFLDRVKTGELLKSSVQEIVGILRQRSPLPLIHLVPLAGTSAHLSLELLRQEFRADLRNSSLRLSHSIHETLGYAKPGEVIIFVDDNIGTGTQFSAQLLRWSATMTESHSESLRLETGIEQNAFDENRRELFQKLEFWLATCVGSPTGEAKVKENLVKANLNFSGVRFGTDLGGMQTETTNSTLFTDFMSHVGSECLRHCRGIEKVDASCREDALGYEGMKGLTVTLWNVPTSTYAALWAPGIVDGEPWCPLFIRRGYVQNLVIA